MRPSMIALAGVGGCALCFYVASVGAKPSDRAAEPDVAEKPEGAPIVRYIGTDNDLHVGPALEGEYILYDNYSIEPVLTKAFVKQWEEVGFKTVSGTLKAVAGGEEWTIKPERRYVWKRRN